MKPLSAITIFIASVLIQPALQRTYAQEAAPALIHRLTPDNPLGQGVTRYSPCAIWGIQRVGIAVNCEPRDLQFLQVTEDDLRQRIERQLRDNALRPVPLDQVLDPASPGVILEVRVTLVVTPGVPAYAANSQVMVRKACRLIFDEQTVTDSVIWTRSTVGLVTENDRQSPLTNVDDLIRKFAEEKRGMDTAFKAFESNSDSRN